MALITIDFESYWDVDVTLSKLSVWEYIRHPKFKVHMCGVKIDDGETVVVAADSIKEYLLDHGVESSAVCGHNMSAFDGLILSDLYGIKPAAYVDTKAMAVYYDPRQKSHSLNACAKRYLEDQKIEGALVNTKGVVDILPGTDLYNKTAEYCAQDVELCYRLAKFFKPHIPEHEMMLMDETARMNCEPTLYINKEKVGGIVTGIISERREVLTALGLTDSDEDKKVFSPLRLAKELEKEGVVVPMKPSEKTGKLIPALSKEDCTLETIAENGNDRVKLLVKGRELFSSNLPLTRMHRWLKASKGGTQPISFPLIYFGAKNTGRWSGAGKLNGQNIPRDGGMRECIFAAPGKVFIIVDYSAIEMRTCAYIAGEERILNAYRNGVDIYCDVGSDILGMEVTKETKRERFISKTICLAGIYGVGPARVQASLKKSGIVISEDEARKFVYGFRDAVPNIVALWRELDRLIQRGFVVLPSGRKITYPKIHNDADRDETVFWNGQYWEKIYGAKATEGVSQGTARDILGYHWLKLKEAGVKVSMQVHDEFVISVNEADADRVAEQVVDIMRAPPPFCTDIPLDCEYTISEFYTK